MAVVAVIGIVIILLLVVVIIVIKSRRKSTNIKSSCKYCWFTSSIVGSHSSVWEPTSILACQHLNQRMQFVWLGCSDACSIVAEQNQLYNYSAFDPFYFQKFRDINSMTCKTEICNLFTFFLGLHIICIHAVYDRMGSPVPEHSLDDSIYSGSTTQLVKDVGGKVSASNTLSRNPQFTNPLYDESGVEKDGRSSKLCQ